MQTRRYPRTLVEAFGPHTSHDLLPMRQPARWFDGIASVVLALVIGIAGAALLVHQLSKS